MSKIWIFNHYAHTPENGNITRHYDFAGILQERGHDVTIFTSGAVHNTDINECPNGELYVEKNIEGRHYVFVKTRTYGNNGIKRALNMTDFYFNLQRVSKHFAKPDIIYASSPHIFTLRAGLKVAKRLKVPCLCEVRDLWPLSVVEYSRFTNKNLGIKFLYKTEKSIYKKSDGLIFTMAGAVHYLQEHDIYDELSHEKISHVSNGVNLAKFDEDARIHAQFAAENYPKEGFCITFTGALRSLYRLDFLLDCAKRIQDLGHNDIRFVVYGAGGESTSLKQRCKDESIENVIFMGRVDKDYIPAILQRGDVNLWHSREVPLMKYGTSPNKLFEYLASGKPILATFSAYDCPVTRYDCGVTLKKQEVEPTVEAILKLYQMPKETREQMGERAREAAKEYDLPILCEKLEDTIKNTISRYKKA